MGLSRRTVLKTISAGTIASIAGCTTVSTAPVNDSEQSELTGPDADFNGESLQTGMTEKLVSGDDNFIENVDFKPHPDGKGIIFKFEFVPESETDIMDFYVYSTGAIVDIMPVPYGGTITRTVSNEQFESKLTIVGRINGEIDSVIKSETVYKSTK